MKKLTGTGVAMVTPFTADRAPDLDTLQQLTRSLIDGGVDFLVVLGTTGESATLGDEEQAQVIDTILEENDSRLPVVLGVGGNDTRKVARKMEIWTQRYRPDAFLSVSPYYNKPTQEGIYQHFREVARSTDLPVILYNVPGRTSSNMLPATTLRLAHDFKNVVAVKEASGNIEQGMEIIREKPSGFLVLSGDDVLVLPQIAAGFDGVISVAGNAIPGPVSSMVRAALAGKFADARATHYQIMLLMQLLFAEGNPAGVKLALEHLGLGTRQVRLPLVAGSDALASRIQEALKAIAAS